MIPDLTRAVGVPRLAGISYPMGRPLGRPHDADGQRAVLRSMLELLTRKPWLLVNLYTGHIPLEASAA